MTPPPLVLLPLTGTYTSLRRTQDIVYCSVSARLMECAQTVAGAVPQWQHRDGNDAGGFSSTIRYKSARIAVRSGSTLQALRRQRSENAGITVDAQPAMMDSSGLRLQCTLEELLPHGDFRALAQAVAEAQVGATIAVEKRLKKLAASHAQLFDPSLVAGITIDAGYDTAVAKVGSRSWVRCMIEEHGSILAFLRLFVSLCSSVKPPENFAANTQHNVEIIDLATTVVDGVRVPFNAPRRAALFTLAVTGTESVPVEKFARGYDSYLTGTSEAANYWKIFAQSMQGLQKSLPFLRVVKVRPNHRTIFGLNIKSAVAPEQLEEWLRGRRQKVDPTL